MHYLKAIKRAGELPNAPVKYRDEVYSIRMATHNTPLSISENECNYLRNFVVTYNLKSGLEIGTGFGVSTTALGLGFRVTGGYLASIDSYLEEKTGQMIHDDKGVYLEAACYKSARFLINEFGLEKTVDLFCGTSPNDIPLILKDRKLDLVFIDGMHSDDALIKDINAIMPFLADKFVLFLHDVHCFSEEINDFLIKKFGKTYTILDVCDMNEQLGYNLSIIDRLKN